MYRAAMQSIWSELVRQGRLVVTSELDIDAPKTKVLAEKLSTMDLSNVLIIAGEVSDALYLSARNLPHVDVRDTDAIDPVSLISFEKVLVTVDALKAIEEQLGMNQERIFTVLRGPHVSGKATVVADQNNQYVFKVASDATKPEIKAAVEALFEVSVTKVNVVNLKGKSKRTARGMGRAATRARPT